MEGIEPLKLADSGATLAESVYETLLEAIVSGHLPAGTVLSEVALARDLSVSRTPVHDALRMLAKDGLIEQEAGRRARVADFSSDDVFEIFEMRKFLEGPAAEMAATRMDRRQLIPLRVTAEELEANRGAVDWQKSWIEYDERFHDAVAKASGNKRLWKDIAGYRMLHRGLNLISTNEECLQQALAEHKAILDALERSDPEGARAAMIAHLNTWQDYFVRHFPRRDED